jgi:hypothetical protein
MEFDAKSLPVGQLAELADNQERTDAGKAFPNACELHSNPFFQIDRHNPTDLFYRRIRT